MPNDSHATTNERRSFDFRLRPSRFALYSSVQHGLDAVFFRSDFQSSSNLKWENKIKSIIFFMENKTAPLHPCTHAHFFCTVCLSVCVFARKFYRWKGNRTKQTKADRSVADKRSTSARATRSRAGGGAWGFNNHAPCPTG